MSNDLAGNQLVVLRRNLDGTLAPAATLATGGAGSGAFEDAANGIVLGDSRGESAPNNLTEARQLLFVTNARSGSITVYRVTGDGTARRRSSPARSRRRARGRCRAPRPWW